MHFPILSNFRRCPDRDAAMESYEHLSGDYDESCHWIDGIRAEALILLALREGDKVLDVACGSGAMFSALSSAVGARGTVIGIEQSKEMAAIAARRAAEAPLGNVRLVVGPVEEAQIEGQADAALFCFTHDVLQSDEAIANVIRHTRARARVVVAGVRLLGWRAAPLNVWKLWRSRHYLSTYSGLRDPASRLRRHCPDLRVLLTRTLGTTYLAVGHVSHGAQG